MIFFIRFTAVIVRSVILIRVASIRVFVHCVDVRASRGVTEKGWTCHREVFGGKREKSGVL